MVSASGEAMKNKLATADIYPHVQPYLVRVLCSQGHLVQETDTVWEIDPSIVLCPHCGVDSFYEATFAETDPFVPLAPLVVSPEGTKVFDMAKVPNQLLVRRASPLGR